MKRFLKLLAKLEFYISSAAFLLMVIVIVFNVFSRTLTNKSFSSAEELSYLGFTWSVFFGVTILYRNNALIAVGTLVDRFSPKIKRIAELIIYVILAIANFIMVVLSFRLAQGAWTRPTPALQIPYFFMDIPATIAFTLMLFYSILFIIDLAQGKEIADAAIEERQ